MYYYQMKVTSSSDWLSKLVESNLSPSFKSISFQSKYHFVSCVVTDVIELRNHHHVAFRFCFVMINGDYLYLNLHFSDYCNLSLSSLHFSAQIVHQFLCFIFQNCTRVIESFKHAFFCYLVYYLYFLAKC